MMRSALDDTLFENKKRCLRHLQVLLWQQLCSLSAHFTKETMVMTRKAV
jgi:hypothetical protein